MDIQHPSIESKEEEDLSENRESENMEPDSPERNKIQMTESLDMDIDDDDDDSILPPPPPEEEEEKEEEEKEEEEKEEEEEQDYEEEEKKQFEDMKEEKNSPEHDQSDTNHADDETYGFVAEDYSAPPSTTSGVKTMDLASSSKQKSRSRGMDDEGNEEPTIEPSIHLPPMHEVTTNALVVHHGSTPLEAENNQKYQIKVDRRLNEALQRHNGFGERRSPDLIPLTRSYNNFRKELRILISNIKKYQKAILQANKARSKVFDQYIKMSQNSPLYDSVGKLMNDDPNELQGGKQEIGSLGKDSLDVQSTTSLEKLLEQTEILSLASIDQLMKLYDNRSTKEYETFIIDYAVEWENIVTSRLDKEIKEVNRLQGRKIHYERKVAGLRKRTNNLEAKGKAVPTTTAEKLVRNEGKLINSFELHETRSAQLCVLLEEVTENGYKDLYALLKNSIRYEINQTSRAEVSKSRLKANLSAMKVKSFDTIGVNQEVVVDIEAEAETENVQQTI